jgi:hypothetical protein
MSEIDSQPASAKLELAAQTGKPADNVMKIRPVAAL